MWRLRKQLVIDALKAGDSPRRLSRRGRQRLRPGRGRGRGGVLRRLDRADPTEGPRARRRALRQVAGDRRSRRSPPAARSTGAAAPPKPRAIAGERPAVLRRRGQVPDHLLWPARRRQGRPDHAHAGQGPGDHRRRPRPLRGSRGGPRGSHADRDRRQGDLTRTSSLALAETLPTDAEAAQLVDLVRGYGDQDLSMKVVRVAAQHGFVLPERGYPLHATPGGGSRGGRLRARHHPPGERLRSARALRRRRRAA